MEVKNAKIESVSLGIEDHGLLSAWVNLTYGGSGQGFGGYCLAGPACAAFVRRTLEVVGVGNWEDLPGQTVRVSATHNKVEAIGHLLNDVWYYPDEEMKELQKEWSRGPKEAT
jgi:hypothetical protein